MNKEKETESLVDASVSPKLVEQYEKALGKLAMEFSFLHVVLEQAAWWIWGLRRDVGRILTKDLRFSHLVEKLRSTTKILDFDEMSINELNEILKKAGQLSERRNELLHAMWDIDEGRPVLCFTNHKAKEGPTILEMDQLGKEMVKTATDLFRFHKVNDSLARLAITQKDKDKKPTDTTRQPD